MPLVVLLPAMSYVHTEDVHSASTPVEINANKVPPLDPTNYAADEEFLSTVTGIKDAEELKQHVLDVQAEAYAVRALRAPVTE